MEMIPHSSAGKATQREEHTYIFTHTGAYTMTEKHTNTYTHTDTQRHNIITHSSTGKTTQREAPKSTKTYLQTHLPAYMHTHRDKDRQINITSHIQTCKKIATFAQSGRMCGVGSQRTCSHFFWLIAHILTIFDKKYRTLTCCDKRESYLIVLQQNNV